MSKKRYTIDDLRAMAWETAVISAGRKLGMDEHYALCQWVYVTATARKMGMRFDINGELL